MEAIEAREKRVLEQKKKQLFKVHAKELSEQTGKPLKACHAALKKANNDVDIARRILNGEDIPLPPRGTTTTTTTTRSRRGTSSKKTKRGRRGRGRKDDDSSDEDDDDEEEEERDSDGDVMIEERDSKAAVVNTTTVLQPPQRGSASAAHVDLTRSVKQERRDEEPRRNSLAGTPIPGLDALRIKEQGSRKRLREGEENSRRRSTGTFDVDSRALELQSKRARITQSSSTNPDIKPRISAGSTVSSLAEMPSMRRKPPPPQPASPTPVATLPAVISSNGTTPSSTQPQQQTQQQQRQEADCARCKRLAKREKELWKRNEALSAEVSSLKRKLEASEKEKAEVTASVQKLEETIAMLKKRQLQQSQQPQQPTPTTPPQQQRQEVDSDDDETYDFLDAEVEVEMAQERAAAEIQAEKEEEDEELLNM